MKKALTLKNQLAWELTTEEILWMRENVKKYTDKQMAEIFKCSYARIRHFKDLYGIRKQVQQKWTEKEVEMLRTMYTKMGDKEISERLNRSMKGIGKKRKYLGLKRTPEQLFYIRKRNSNRNGEILRAKVYCKNGEKWFDEYSRVWYIRIDDCAIPWHRWQYEQLHGPIPKGHLVLFADGNKMNTADENLILAKRKRGRNEFKKYVGLIKYNQDKKRANNQSNDNRQHPNSSNHHLSDDLGQRQNLTA